MDLREYYSRIREVESSLDEADVVMVSLATPDGGKAGVLTEAPRHVAAKQIAEGRAKLATDDVAAGFHESNARRKRERDENDAMNRIQFVVMPQKHSPKPAKD